MGAPLEQLLKKRNPESGGFAAAGRRAREDVVACQSNGNSRALNRRGLGVVKILDAASYRSIKVKF